MRLEMIGENVTTIEKAMKQVIDLSDGENPDLNQIVRWTMVKDQHADDIADILSWYFLQQRVKPADPEDTHAYEEYLRKLTLIHKMLVHSMKAKQTLDLEHVERLRELLEDFTEAYSGHGHSH
jgi:nickel superoxide dismutase